MLKYFSSLQSTSAAQLSSPEQLQPPSVSLRFIVALLMFIYFEIGYIWSARDVSSYAYDGAIWLDSVLPLVPFFIVFYMLGYLFVFSPCFTLKNKVDFYWGTAIFFLILSISFLIFKHFPVVMEKTIATSSDGFSQLTQFQQKADTKFNNFPSLHVSLNLFAFFIFTHNTKKLFWAVLPLPILIIASTLLVKQHLIIDVVGGVTLALLAYQLFKIATSIWRKVAFSAFVVSLIATLTVLLMNIDMLARIYRIVIKFAKNASVGISSEIIILIVVLTAIGWYLLKRFKR
jgi:membrane-associated phospholipid phosphatase